MKTLHLCISIGSLAIAGCALFIDPGTPDEECGAGEYLKFEDGACGVGDDGVCTDIPSICTEEYAPVCGCDGMTYATRCVAASAEVNVDFEGECESQGNTCGGIAGLTCDDGEFCEFPIGTCGAADQTGTCSAVPDNCTEEVDPVCGCDGQTYGNECEARSAGISVDHAGECDSATNDNAAEENENLNDNTPAEGAICGGIAGLTCDDGQFCQYALGNCGTGDQTGTCAAVPENCTDEFDPVCGCDGLTYDNECAARSASVSVAAEGECASNL